MTDETTGGECAYCDRAVPTPEVIKSRPACAQCHDNYLDLLLATGDW